MNKVDLSEKLTVFVISAGNNPNLSHTLFAMKNQTVDFRLQRIHNVYPLSKAFQCMIDECKTDYYVEVDEDMVLKPDAIEKMYKYITESNPQVAMASFRLFDVHSEQPIYGIKIYKHTILKDFPYNLEHPSCEVEQISRFEKKGFKNMVVDTEPIGDHSPYWTERLIFERYYNLMKKFRKYNYVWMERLPEKLFQIFRKHPTMVNMYALLGAYTGIISENEFETEKDFTKRMNEFQRIGTYYSKPSQITLYMTNKCNLKCKFCKRQHGDIPTAKDMTPTMISDMLFKFPSIKSACVCGWGSPLMSPNFEQCMAYLREKGIFVGLITNGILIDEKFDTLVNNAPNYLSISLNAHDRESYLDATQVDCWDRVIRNAKLISEKTNIPLYISSVVSINNIAHVGKLLEVAKSVGAKKVHLHNLLPHCEESGYEQFWNEVLTVKHKPMVDALANLPNADIIDRYPVLIDRDTTPMLCKFPWRSLAMDGDGYVSFCNSVLPCNIKYGNIRDWVVWNSAKSEAFRKDFVERKIPQCQMCFRNWEYVP